MTMLSVGMVLLLEFEPVANVDSRVDSCGLVGVSSL